MIDFESRGKDDKTVKNLPEHIEDMNQVYEWIKLYIHSDIPKKTELKIFLSGERRVEIVVHGYSYGKEGKIVLKLKEKVS